MTPIYVISLPNAATRRAAFARNNPGFEYVFHDAVDGRSLDRQDPALARIFSPGLRYSVGAAGLALTTFYLWTQIAAGHQAVTIMEDDGILRTDFHTAAFAALSHARDAHGGEIDLAVWGYNFDSVMGLGLFGGSVSCCMTFDQASLRENIGRFRADRTPASLFHLKEFYGLNAYSVSPTGARQLLERCFPLKDDYHRSPFLRRMLPNAGLDIVMNRHLPELRAFVSFPPLAVSANDWDTSYVQHVNPGAFENPPA